MMSGGVGKYTHIDNQKVSGSVPSVPDPGHVTVQFTADSNLQTFPPSGSQGKISGGTRPPLDADDTFSKPVSGSEESQRGGWFQTFTVAAYKPYFDVDTTDVLERIKYSLFPFRGTFTEKTVNNPDLYGPFWICTTLIFVAASIGTFVTYIAHKLQKKEWNYDINLVTWSAGVFYGYVLLVPLVLYVILKYFSAPSGLVQLFCLYGYSLFVFIPALCLSVIPLEIFRWVIAGVAGFMSATFVALNLRAHIMSAGIRKCELIYSRLVYKNVFPWSQSGCLLLVLLSISAFHHGVVGARNLKENLKAMEETQNEKEGANTEDNNGDVANVNREVPSCPDPIHNR